MPVPEVDGAEPDVSPDDCDGGKVQPGAVGGAVPWPAVPLEPLDVPEPLAPLDPWLPPELPVFPALPALDEPLWPLAPPELPGLPPDDCDDGDWLLGLPPLEGALDPLPELGVEGDGMPEGVDGMDGIVGIDTVQAASAAAQATVPRCRTNGCRCMT